jgi:hypothetical protein
MRDKVVHETDRKSQRYPGYEVAVMLPVYNVLLENQLQSEHLLPIKTKVYMGRRLSMLSIDESVELRPLPLSLTRSLMCACSVCSQLES